MNPIPCGSLGKSILVDAQRHRAKRISRDELENHRLAAAKRRNGWLGHCCPAIDEQFSASAVAGYRYCGNAQRTDDCSSPCCFGYEV
jgi:hypothetical protein